MPVVHPFRAILYHEGDVSRLVAPPYDVLGAGERDALLAGDADNIVGVDLPHVPAKELGPPGAYERAAAKLASMLDRGVLGKSSEPVLFAYRQRFEMDGSAHERCGMACTLDAVAFGPRAGGGVLPHEQTFGGPKADRLALMKATGTQTSPVFGLHPDEDGAATELVRSVMVSRAPDRVATTPDGVRHELWTVADAETIGAYQKALAGQDVFIADGHHRYNTALDYLRSLGDVHADHPARRNMMVLVSMSDPGLVIGPTHRVLGGMSGYSIDAFVRAAEGLLTIEELAGGPEAVEPALTGDGPVFGLIDFETGRCFVARPGEPDPLAQSHADKPGAWRTLDVAIVQHLIVEKICQPRLNGGEPVTWAFPHSVAEALEIGRGAQTGAGGGAGFAQLAVIVRPTPMDAVRAVSLAGEVMPQKSTYFYPKLATGLFLYDLKN